MGILWSCCNDHPTSMSGQSVVTTSTQNNCVGSACKSEYGNESLTPQEKACNLCEYPFNNINSVNSKLLQGCSIVRVLFCGNEDNKNKQPQLAAVYINQIVSAMDGDADASIEISI